MFAKIWMALGNFYTKIVSEEDRVYWQSIWAVISKRAGDLLGYAGQTDRNKSLFSMPASTFRTDLALDFSNISETPGNIFGPGKVRGNWLRVNGPGLDTIPINGRVSWENGNSVIYRGVNKYAPESAALQVVSGTPPDRQGRIDEPFDGETFVVRLAADAMAGDSIIHVENVAGFDANGIVHIDEETRNYSISSSSLMLDEALLLDHPQSLAVIRVSNFDARYWLVSGALSGIDGGRALIKNSVITSIDEVGPNSDFDISIYVDTTDLGPVDVVTMAMSGSGADIRLSLSGTGFLSWNGGTSSSDIADEIELRIKRTTEGRSDFLWRNLNDIKYTFLGTSKCDGGKKNLALSHQGTGTVQFYDPEQRLGTDAGVMTIGEEYPVTADVDENVLKISELLSSPEPVSVNAVVISTDAGVVTIEAESQLWSGHGEIDGARFSVSKILGRTIYEIHTSLPLIKNQSVVLKNLQLINGRDFIISDENKISFSANPRQNRLWAPTAEVDEDVVRKTYGLLVGVTHKNKPKAYLNKVRGTWFSLMSGASVFDIASGVSASLGLPLSSVTGTVSSISKYYDVNGRELKQVMEISGVEHELDSSVGVDWLYDLGDAVKKFAPLTTGVVIIDDFSDSNWASKFENDAERFNTFGVEVQARLLYEPGASKRLTDFLDKVKNTYTKYTTEFSDDSGSDVIDVSDGSVESTLIPRVFEDMSFDEGGFPGCMPWTLGDGHKLGQGLTLDGCDDWYPHVLGEYSRQGPYDDGVVSAGSHEFHGQGGYSKLYDSGTGDGNGAEGTFESSSASFSAQDIDRTIVDVVNATRHTIVSIISATSVIVSPDIDIVDGDWELRGKIFTTQDVGKSIAITYGDIEGVYKIMSVISESSVELDTLFIVSYSELGWELRDYVTLESLTLGKFSAYKSPVPSRTLPTSESYTEQIMTVVI